MGVRNQAIDLAKGIGIILVVWGHYWVPDPPFFKEIFLFHMPFFFIISGCFFDEKNVSSAYLFKRLDKLLFPVVFFFIFFFTIRFLQSRIGEVQSFSSIFNDFSYDRPLSFINPPLWFLVVLFFINTISFIGNRLSIERVPLLILSLIISYIGTKLIALPFYISQSLAVLVFFTIGRFFRDTILNPVVNFKILFTAILIFISIVVLDKSLVNIHEYQYGDNYFYYLLGGFSGSFILIEICKLLPKSKIIIMLGLNSLLIMCIHLPIRGYFLTVAIKISVYFKNHFIIDLIYILLFIGLLFFSYFSSVLIKRFIKKF